MNLIVLFYFKYSNFTFDILRTLCNTIHIDLNLRSIDILLPVGISFYTFQALSYTMDVFYNDIRAERNFFRYALYVSFFPQLVAGPIERSENLLKQFSKTKKFQIDRAREGVLTMLWGYFLKLVIADRCAVLVDTVYGNHTSYYGIQIILANIFFAFQIYCDFMGYSVIARGAAKILGYDLMENFSQPYFSQSIKEFWRRWHISLSYWFRDYLYIPLGGSRCSKIKKYRNIFITFLVSGLWHGANFTFIVWGGLHGFYQIMEDILAEKIDRWCKKFHIETHNFSFRCLNIAKTFVLTDIAWIFFRADKLSSAVRILYRSLDLSNIGILLNRGIYQLGLEERDMSILFVGLIVLLVYGLMREAGYQIQEWLLSQHIIFRFGLYWSALILIIFSLNIAGAEFIYFQF